MPLFLFCFSLKANTALRIEAITLSNVQRIEMSRFKIQGRCAPYARWNERYMARLHSVGTKPLIRKEDGDFVDQSVFSDLRALSVPCRSEKTAIFWV